MTSRSTHVFRHRLALLLTAGLVVSLGVEVAPVRAQEDIPPAVDPGEPTYVGSPDPVPAEPAVFDPSKPMLQSIFDADQAAGGGSYWFDRILERPFSTGGGSSSLYTKGSALYLYTHNPNILGFAGQGTGANAGGGGFAFREAIAQGVTNLYTVTISDATLTEQTAERKQYPSYWSSVHTATGLRVAERKLITHNNTAVTPLDVTNTDTTPTTRTGTGATPAAVTQGISADGTERVGSFSTRYNLTTVSTRFSGDGFTPTAAGLTRTITLDPGQTVTLKLQLGAIAAEIPASGPEYERYRGYSPATALRTQLAEYNRWWVDNVPYIDVPDPNIKKMSYYRTFLNRFNYFDVNIPGNDFQFPVSVEGALGYDNAIQLTQPMHMQDLKWFRHPTASYGNWVSSGETSKCDAFTDNPGSFSWGNTYEQYIAREGWNAYMIHGGDPGVVRNFAHYAECDVEGQLAKYDRGNNNKLIEYAAGALTGNDADAVALQYYTTAVSQDRTESAFWYSGALAAADAYRVLGQDAKATELQTIADNIRTAILTLLWDDTPADSVPTPTPATRVAGQGGFGNAIGLNGANPNQSVTMPAGIVSTLNDFTVATWVNLAATTQWSRVFDFGSGPNTNMFLTVNAGTGPRFALTTSGGGNEQRINPTTAGQLPTGAWIHLAVTLSGNTGTLYVNGTAVGTNPNITLRPSSMGATTQNWIGKSQYGDPGLNGTVDDFAIYDHALSAEEIQALTTAPAAGPGQV